MSALTIIGIAGFASSWMLLWSAAAAIPIVMHLLNRRRQQTVSWAAMRLLLKVIEKQTRRVRLEQLILLLLRTLILVTFALAIARPYFVPPTVAGAVATQRSPRLWIIVIDNSYSMGYREEHGTRFLQAQERGMEMVRTSARGDAFSIITLSSQSEHAILRPTFDSDNAIAAIQGIQLLDGGADLGSALTQIDNMLADVGHNPEIPTDVQVVFISDFGQDTWQEAVGSGRLLRPLRQLAAVHTVAYETLAHGSTSNVAIMNLTPSTTRALKNQSLPIQVSVSNFSDLSVSQLPLQFSANGQFVESQFLDLPAGGTRVLTIKVVPTLTGLLTVSASVPDDRLNADNQRLCITEIRDEFRVLCIENPQSSPKILKTALQPPSTSSSSLRVTSTSQLEFNLLDLNEFDSVILNDVSNFNEADLGRLSRFVESGRSLVCLLGHNSDADAWNKLLGDNPNLLGFRIAEASEIADWHIDPLDYSSPIVAPFAAHPDAGLLTTPIFRYWQIQLPANESAKSQVELRLQGGAPLIVLNRWGKGRTASLLSAPQTGSVANEREPWNAMAAWPSFVPLMQQLVQATLSESAMNYNLTVGKPILGAQRASGETTLVRVVRPDGERADLQFSEVDAAGMRLWSYQATNVRGQYEVTVGDAAPRPFAVNINPVESSLVSIQTSQLPQSANKPLEQAATSVNLSSVMPSNAIAEWLLIALAVMLLAESCLAWQVGRRLG